MSGSDIPASSVASPTVGPATDAFRFGRNWLRYQREYLNSERQKIAAESLADLIPDNLEERSFLDIGSGSGLFSLCAFKAGASRVTSIDVDPEAVAATRYLHEQQGLPDSWTVEHRSILDDATVAELSSADIVYSWGVLHHTGNMYRAIDNAAALVAPGGIFCIAIYNRVEDRFLNSERWLAIKRAYNHSSRPLQRCMEVAYQAYWALGRLRNRTNPLRVAKQYKQSRGMALKTDLVDWLGGYPFEFATAEEITRYCEDRLGMRRERLVPVPDNGNGNNQFVFRRDL